MGCLFCNNLRDVIYENTYIYAIYDKFPVSDGHVLLITKRHCVSYFDATPAEKLAIDEGIMVLKKRLDDRYHPNGYNVGINNGEAAGQTILHLHVHLIPRYNNDVLDPRGGVRGVIPSKQKY